MRSFGVDSRCIIADEQNAGYHQSTLHIPQVHWLRLVLDEGHTLGALAATNKMTCAVNLRAERRCARFLDTIMSAKLEIFPRRNIIVGAL